VYVGGGEKKKEKKKRRGYTTRSEGEGRGKWEMKVFWEL
jgi:hypothetical protein